MTEQAPETIEDGFGSTWSKCGPSCDLVVVRPGKVQCEEIDPACPNYGRCMRCGRNTLDPTDPWPPCPHCEPKEGDQ